VSGEQNPQMIQRLTIGIVEDHLMVAESLGRVLGERYEVVGIARNSAEALQLASDRRPAIILLDISLGQESGLALIAELKRRVPTSAIVMITNFATTEFQELARRLGAHGFISKIESTEDLCRTIDTVASGKSSYSAPQNDLVYMPSRLDPKVHLPPRQLEVLQDLARGLSYKEIAKAMGVSENTVDLYLRRIRDALGGHKAADLVRRGIEHGVLPPP
jgi:DNA-binding NarL/FixJ family response regulator